MNTNNAWKPAKVSVWLYLFIAVAMLIPASCTVSASSLSKNTPLASAPALEGDVMIPSLVANAKPTPTPNTQTVVIMEHVFQRAYPGKDGNFVFPASTFSYMSGYTFTYRDCTVSGAPVDSSNSVVLYVTPKAQIITRDGKLYSGDKGFEESKGEGYSGSALFNPLTCRFEVAYVTGVGGTSKGDAGSWINIDPRYKLTTSDDKKYIRNDNVSRESYVLSENFHAYYNDPNDRLKVITKNTFDLSDGPLECWTTTSRDADGYLVETLQWCYDSSFRSFKAYEKMLLENRGNPKEYTDEFLRWAKSK